LSITPYLSTDTARWQNGDLVLMGQMALLLANCDGNPFNYTEESPLATWQRPSGALQFPAVHAELQSFCSMLWGAAGASRPCRTCCSPPAVCPSPTRLRLSRRPPLMDTQLARYMGASDGHDIWGQVMASMYPDAFRVLQGLIGASGASPHIVVSVCSTWAQLGPQRTHTGIAPLRGIAVALSWPFGPALLRDLMLPWALGRSGSSPPPFAEPGVDSDSRNLSLGDLEEVGLPVAAPALVWRRLFRFTLGVMGFNLEGTDEFVEICHLLDRRYRSAVGRGLPIS
jgi:hypothetical protein